MRIAMNKAEIKQIEVMEKLKRGEIAQGPASDMIGRSVRTVRRKLYRYKANGAEGLVHCSRGRPSNRKTADAVYSDRGGVYKVNNGNENDDRITQYERALNEIGIELKHAYSPQAKGRIERSFLTDQDRLVKELQLRNVTSVEQANEFVEPDHQVVPTQFQADSIQTNT